MPRIDKIVELMSLGNHAEAVLLSDSPLRLKSDGGEEELSVSLTHRQITSMVEEILPSNLFSDLVMMKPVEFNYRHPAGGLEIKAVPGDSLWRVIIKAPQGLDPFRAPKSRRGIPDEKIQWEDSDDALLVEREDEVVDEDAMNETTGGEEGMGEGVVGDEGVGDEITNEDIVEGEVLDEGIVNKNGDVMEKNGGGEEIVDKEDMGEVAVDKNVVDKEDMDEVAVDEKTVGEEVVDKNVVDKVVVDEKAVGEAQERKENEYSEHVSPKPAPSPEPQPESKPSAEHCLTERARGLTLEVTSECDELIERAKIAKSGVLLLIPGQRPWVYGPQGYTPMTGARSPVTDDLLCELMKKNEEAARCSKTRHALRAIYGDRKESSYIRCTLTQNRGLRTAAFRIPLVDPSHPSHIGLPPHTSELLSGGGVLLAASPCGGGRTTTAFLIGSALMSSGLQLGLSIGRPVERKLIVSAPNFSFDMSHREFPRGVMLAQDLGASVVVLDDGPPISIERALRLAEVGIAVVFTIQADSAVGALTRSLGHIKKWKNQIPRLSRLLKGVIYQELIWTKESNRSPVFERLLPDYTLLEAMAREQWELLGGKRGASVTSPSFAESLKALADNGVIDRHTASKHSHKN